PIVRFRSVANGQILNSDGSSSTLGLLAKFNAACWSRAARGTTVVNTKGEMTDEDVNAPLRVYSMRSDHECHWIRSALLPDQYCFQRGRSRSCHRSSTHQPVGPVPKLRQPMVGL